MSAPRPAETFLDQMVVVGTVQPTTLLTEMRWVCRSWQGWNAVTNVQP